MFSILTNPEETQN